MPQIGEIKTVKELGKTYKHRATQYQKYIWVICPQCQLGRWKNLKQYKTSITGLCSACFKGKRGRESHNWKGGRQKTTNGYIEIMLEPTDFFFPMTDPHGYIKEHRFIMAQHLGRCLHPWEEVHHKGAKDDNRIEKLELVIKNYHRGKVRCPYCNKEFSIK